MIAPRIPQTTQLRKQRLLEASMECFWMPARLLFKLWILLTPSYSLSPQEQAKAKAGSSHRAL